MSGKASDGVPGGSRNVPESSSVGYFQFEWEDRHRRGKSDKGDEAKMTVSICECYSRDSVYIPTLDGIHCSWCNRNMRKGTPPRHWINRETGEMGEIGLPKDAKLRKAIPITTGVLDYFPDALVAVAQVSQAGNDQHHPGTSLHWDKSKSSDEADSLMRHLIDRGKIDSDGMRHSAKVAWRALALLQREIEGEKL